MSKVIDKRSALGRGEIRRRRQCLKCGERFTTYEGLAKLEITVVKKDGRKESYQREKLKTGLIKALEKRPSLDKVEKIVDKIETRIKKRKLKEIRSSWLGKCVLGELKKLDEVAYLRFASVYHQFGKAADFAEEIKSL